MIHCYVDSSVWLRWLLNAAGMSPDFGTWEFGISSILLDVEVRRTLHRFFLAGDLDARELQHLAASHERLMKAMHLIEVDARVASRAGIPLAVSVRTLDAVHVTSAVLYREEFECDPLTFLTHDRNQARAAALVGLDVRGADS